MLGFLAAASITGLTAHGETSCQPLLTTLPPHPPTRDVLTVLCVTVVGAEVEESLSEGIPS